MKKFIAIVMTLALVCSLGATAFAAEIANTSEGDSAQSEIVYNLETSYCVWIPESIEVSAGPYTFMASQMNLGENEQVTVRMSDISEHSYIYLENGSGGILKCNVEYNYSAVAPNNIVAVFTDSLSADGQLRITPSNGDAHRTGQYSGIYEFVVSVEERTNQ